MEFHQLANEYPIAEQWIIDAIAGDMELNGFDAACPILVFEDRILDGRCRYLAAKKAKIDPKFDFFSGSADEASALVERRNELRRHLTETWLTTRRASIADIRRDRDRRIAAVMRLRMKGFSEARIAERLDVPRTTVSFDIRAARPSYEANGHTLPPVISTNGHVYPPRRQTVKPKVREFDRVQSVTRIDGGLKLVIQGNTFELSYSEALSLAKTMRSMLSLARKPVTI